MEKNKISINEKYAVSISELSLLLGIGEHTSANIYHELTSLRNTLFLWGQPFESKDRNL